MKKASISIILFAAIASGCTAVASDGKHTVAPASQNMGMMTMSSMDTDRDGVISKQEFMMAHERMFDRMKNKDGVIDAKKGGNCCSGMMGGMGNGMMGGEKMQGHSMMEACPMMKEGMGKGST